CSPISGSCTCRSCQPLMCPRSCRQGRTGVSFRQPGRQTSGQEGGLMTWGRGLPKRPRSLRRSSDRACQRSAHYASDSPASATSSAPGFTGTTCPYASFAPWQGRERGFSRRARPTEPLCRRCSLFPLTAASLGCWLCGQGALTSEDWNQHIAQEGWRDAILETPPGWAVLLKGSAWQGGGPGVLHCSPAQASKRVVLQIDVASYLGDSR
ncbi:unnamed protein product, partial [Effrenium voratum]